MRRWLSALAAGAALVGGGCATQPDEGVTRQVGYRAGTADDDYLNNGERGNIQITEIMWAGSVKGTGLDRVHDPDDVFIELQNKNSRPVYLTGWLLTVQAGHDLDGYDDTSRSQRSRITYVLPARENGRPLEQNEFAVIAAKRDGAFEADFYIEDLALPDGPFTLSLQDLDERLIDGAGDARKRPFAGAWDRVTARSMERIQLIFNNRGNRDSSWHTYSLNDFDVDERAELHQSLRSGVREEWRLLTFATPGRPNSPDYSGNISSGSFE